MDIVLRLVPIPQVKKSVPHTGRSASSVKSLTTFQQYVERARERAVCRASAKQTQQHEKRKQHYQPDRRQQKNTRQRRQIKRTTEGTADSFTSSDEEFFCQAVRHLKQVKKSQFGDKAKTLKVRIEDVDVDIEPDSGAEVNVMDEHQFKELKNRTSQDLTLAPSRTKLNTLQSELSVKREFA